LPKERKNRTEKDQGDDFTYHPKKNCKRLSKKKKKNSRGKKRLAGRPTSKIGKLKDQPKCKRGWEGGARKGSVDIRPVRRGFGGLEERQKTFAGSSKLSVNGTLKVVRGTEW